MGHFQRILLRLHSLYNFLIFALYYNLLMLEMKDPMVLSSREASSGEAMETEFQPQSALWKSEFQGPERVGETNHHTSQIPGSCNMQEKKIEPAGLWLGLVGEKAAWILISWERPSETHSFTLFFMPSLTVLLHIYWAPSVTSTTRCWRIYNSSQGSLSSFSLNTPFLGTIISPISTPAKKLPLLRNDQLIFSFS